VKEMSFKSGVSARPDVLVGFVSCNTITTPYPTDIRSQL